MVLRRYTRLRLLDLVLNMRRAVLTIVFYRIVVDVIRFDCLAAYYKNSGDWKDPGENPLSVPVPHNLKNKKNTFQKQLLAKKK